MALCVGRFSSLLVLLSAVVLAGMLPSTCLAANHTNHTEDDHDHATTTTEDDHDHDHDHTTTTVEDDHDHDHGHDHDHPTTTVGSHDHDHGDHDHDDHKNETGGDDHKNEKGGDEHKHETEHDDDHDHDDHDHDDHKNETGGDEHKNETKHDHDHDHEKDTGDSHKNHTEKDGEHDHDHDHDHETDVHSNHTSSGTDAHDEGVIYGEFKVVVAEDQESMLKDAKVIGAFEKAYASFAGVADSAVHVKFLDNVDHSGHNHRRLQAQHEQDGEYEIKTKGLTNATVQAAVKKLQLAKDTTSKANELKAVIRSKIQDVPGFIALRIQSVALLTSPVVKEATTSTPTETSADSAKQASCHWMHYSLFAAAWLMKSLI